MKAIFVAVLMFLMLMSSQVFSYEKHSTTAQLLSPKHYSLATEILVVREETSLILRLQQEELTYVEKIDPRSRNYTDFELINIDNGQHFCFKSALARWHGFMLKSGRYIIIGSSDRPFSIITAF